MVDHVRDPDLGRDRVAALVDVLLDRGVRVTVDDPRHEVAAGRVDHGGAGRDQEVAADGGDLAVPDEHRTLLDRALGTGGQDRSAHDRDENRPGRNARSGVNPSLAIELGGLYGPPKPPIPAPCFGLRRGRRGRRLLRLVELPVDEDHLRLRVLGEGIARPRHHVRDLARLEAAGPIGDAERLRRLQRERAERDVPGQPALDRLAHSGQEVGRVGRHEGEADAGLVQLGGVSLRVLDVAALLFLVTKGGAGEAGGPGRVEVHAHEQRQLAGLDQLGDAERLRGARDRDPDLELVRDRHRAPHVVLAEGGDHERLLSREEVLPGGDGGVVAGPLLSRGGALVGRPLVAIPDGVVERLPRISHRAHERARVLPGERAHVEVERGRLLERHRLGLVTREVQDHALPRQHALPRDHQHRGDAGVARLERIGHADAVEGHGLRGQRAWGRAGCGAAAAAAPAAARGGGGKPGAGERVDDPGREDEAVGPDHPRVGRSGDARAHGLDDAVAHDERPVVDRRPGHGDDARAHQRVHVGPCRADGVRRRRRGHYRERGESSPQRLTAHGALLVF